MKKYLLEILKNSGVDLPKPDMVPIYQLSYKQEYKIFELKYDLNIKYKNNIYNIKLM